MKRAAGEERCCFVVLINFDERCPETEAGAGKSGKRGREAGCPGKRRMSGEKAKSSNKPPGRAESVQKTERIGTKRQCVTTGTERIPRVETQAAGCSGTHRRIKSGERNPPRNGEAYPFYRENPRSDCRTNDCFLVVRQPLRGWFPVRDDLLENASRR